MKATLVLTSPILNGTTPSALTAAVRRSAAELESDIKLNMQRSIPGGRVYRIGSIVRKSNRRNAVPGLRKRGPDSVIVGSTFYRASRRGQPPAIKTGRLFNAIRSSSISPTSSRVAAAVAYALPLDDPDGLDRPFFMSRAELYRPRFVQNVSDALNAK